MKKVIYTLIAVMMVAGLVVGCAAPAPAPTPAPAPAPVPAPAPTPTIKPITLKAIIAMPYRPGGRGQAFVDLCKNITEQAKGELVIDFLGGAEVIPPFDQFEALRGGVIDMGWIYAGAYQRLVPEVISYCVSELSKAEEREVGYYDFLVEHHKGQDVFYLGRLGGDGFLLQCNKLIKTPYSDFRGLKFAVTGRMYNSFLQKLGIVPAMIPPAEKYTALERGVVDGNAVAGWGSAVLGYGEVTKYQIDHAFWLGAGSSNLIRLETWNSIPKHLQDLIIEEEIKAEELCGPYNDKMVQEEKRELLEQGMEFLTFSPEDAKWYVDTAMEAKWEELQGAAPESYPMLREMLRK